MEIIQLAVVRPGLLQACPNPPWLILQLVDSLVKQAVEILCLNGVNSYLAEYGNFMPTIPIPKFPKRAPQSFNIRDVSQLMRKLTIELSQFMESQASSTLSGYLALNVAMTAWHMIDWLNKDMNAEQRKRAAQYLKCKEPISDNEPLGKAVTNACDALRICQVIATAGKHVEVEGKPDRTLATHFKLVRPNPNEAKRPGEGLSYIWIITRNPRKRKKEEYLAETVFKEAHRFWEDLLSHLGMIEDPFNGRGRRGW